MPIARAMTGSTDQRITRLETSVEQLSRSITEYAKGAESDRLELFSRLDALQREFLKSRQTNWPLMVTAGGLLVGVMMMLGGLVLFSNRATISPLESSLSALTPAVNALALYERSNAMDIRELQTRVSILVPSPKPPN